MILTFVLLLAFLLLPQQALADEDVRYVYPVIETNCDRINATAYRFHPGNYLNFTFTFTTSESVYAYYYRNITIYQNFYGNGRFYDFFWSDGIQSGEGYRHIGTGEGYGYTRGYVQVGFAEAGEHTVEIIYLFITYGDADGFIEMNFLLEPRLTIEKINSTPVPLIPLLTGGVSGAAIAFVVSAVIWHKRSSAKKEENNVNP